MTNVEKAANRLRRYYETHELLTKIYHTKSLATACERRDEDKNLIVRAYLASNREVRR